MVARSRAARQGGETATVLVPVEAGDPRLADYVELPDPAARRRIERDELFVVEGLTAITRLLSSGHPIRSVLITPQALRTTRPRQRGRPGLRRLA